MVNPARPLDVARLVEEHADYLFHYALKHFAEEDAAQELVQETLLGALENVERFRGEASPRTWLTSILRYKIFDRLRRQSREKIVEKKEETEFDPGDVFFDDVEHWRVETGPLPWDQNPENVASQKQFLVRLEECLKKLPTRHRQAFLLREIEDLEQDKICNELDLSPTNLRVMLCRSRVQLRECLHQHWFRPEKAQARAR